MSDFRSEQISQYELGYKKRLQIKRYNNAIFLDIREYFCKSEDNWLPTKKGVTLTIEMWEKLLSMQEQINEEIKQFCGEKPAEGPESKDQ